MVAFSNDTCTKTTQPIPARLEKLRTYSRFSGQLQQFVLQQIIKNTGTRFWRVCTPTTISYREDNIGTTSRASTVYVKAGPPVGRTGEL